MKRKRISKKNASKLDRVHASLAEREFDKQRKELHASMTAYYDSLSEEEQQADRDWGMLAEDGLAALDE